LFIRGAASPEDAPTRDPVADAFLFLKGRLIGGIAELVFPWLSPTREYFSENLNSVTTF
jgi:hypothetical protein